MTFTPFDTKDYTSATAESHINVDSSNPTPRLVTVTSAKTETIHLKKRKTAYELVIAFSGAINAVDADDLANYHLAAPGKGKKSKTYNKVIHLNSVVYDTTAHQVTLLLKGKPANSTAAITNHGCGHSRRLWPASRRQRRWPARRRLRGVADERRSSAPDLERSRDVRSPSAQFMTRR